MAGGVQGPQVEPRIMPTQDDSMPNKGAHLYSSTGVRQRLKKRTTTSVEFKNAQQMENEDKRVKHLTEAVLYEFLPTALNVMLPHCEDPLQDLDAGRCRAVAGAALAVAALLNAPPGFLEFLLCVPWRKLTQLYPKSDTIDKLISNLHVTDDERKRLVNVRMEPALMRVVLDFLYRPEHVAGLPPMLAVRRPPAGVQPAEDLQDGKPGGAATLETVAAVLDGATPLHCAALRGNPAQVDHLLSCGADPGVRTTAGELPLQLVPVCRTRGSGATCRCMGPSDQEKWECKSRLARSLIAQRSVSSPWRMGCWAWIKMLVLCMLCMLGLWANYTTICRPVIEQHVLTRRQRKKQGARIRALNLMLRMRSEANQGHVHLAAAKQEASARAQTSGWPQTASLHQGGTSSDPSTPTRIDLLHPPRTNTSLTTSPNGQAGGAMPAVAAAAAAVVDLTFANKAPPSAAPTSIHDINVHLKESEAVDALGEEQASEKAFKCFVRAVHSLQSLDLQGETIAQVLNEPLAPGEPISPSAHVLEDEQAVLYCCWAESVMLKFGRTCTCPGCAALAVQAVRMAHAQTSKLYQRAEAKHNGLQSERVRNVGHCLARVVHVYITLLLDSEAQSSPTRASVWRAEQCLREWDRLAACGLADEGFSAGDLAKVSALRLWARTADSDLYIAEALLGSMLGPAQSLQEILAMTVANTDTNRPYLARGVNAEVVHQLEQALTLALLPSPSLSHLAKALVVSSSQELAAGVRLREVIGSTRMPANEDTADFITSLVDIIAKAEEFPRLAGDVAICQNILEKWSARADAVGRLMSVIDDVRHYTDTNPLLPSASHIAATGTTAANTPTPAHGKDKEDAQTGGSMVTGGIHTQQAGSGGGAVCSHTTYDLNAWDEKLKQLEAAIQEAKEATIGVAKAKRLLKELQAQATAAKAASQLEVVLSKKPAGAAALKAGLTKAESAASALSGINLAGSAVGQAIQALVLSAKRRLEVERALDALSKACSSCKAVADLPKLEAAIINARKVGSEDLDPEVYRTASDLRAKLSDAARARAALDLTLKAVQKGPRAEDAEALEKAIADASRWEDLLFQDLSKGREALGAWKSQTASEAKLARALRDGAPMTVLSRAIADAAAAGVKVQHARKVHKLLQGVDQALNITGDGPAALLSLLRSRIDAAEQGGVPPTHPIMISAQSALRRLLAADARDALELAIKQPGGDAKAYERVAALRAALSKAEEVVGATAIASVCQDSRANGAGPSSRAQSLPASREVSVMSDGSHGAATLSKRNSHDVPHAAAAATAVPAARAASCGAPAADGNTTTAARMGEALDTESDAGVAREDSSDSMPSGPLSEIVGSMISVTISDDDADMAMLLELARRAWLLMEVDQKELARQEAERAAVERERRDRQDREKAERARAEQERKQRGTDKRGGPGADKSRPDKPSRGSKVKVDLASISAASHFGGGGGGGGFHAPPIPPPVVPLHKPPPPPPPPPPRKAAKVEASAAPLATNGSWKSVIAGTAGQAARQAGNGPPDQAEIKPLARTASDTAGILSTAAALRPGNRKATEGAVTMQAGAAAVPPSPRLSAAAPTFTPASEAPQKFYTPGPPGSAAPHTTALGATSQRMPLVPLNLQPKPTTDGVSDPALAMLQHANQQQKLASALAQQQQRQQQLATTMHQVLAAGGMPRPNSPPDSLGKLSDPHRALNKDMLVALDGTDLPDSAVMPSNAYGAHGVGADQHLLPAFSNAAAVHQRPFAPMHQHSTAVSMLHVPPPPGYGHLAGDGPAPAGGATNPPTGLAADTSSQRSSIFSSAASTEDVLSGQAGHLGHIKHVPETAVADAGVMPGRSKFRFGGNVDLGGFSWGLDSKAVASIGAVPAAGTTMAEFHSILGDGKGQGVTDGPLAGGVQEAAGGMGLWTGPAWSPSQPQFPVDLGSGGEREVAMSRPSSIWSNANSLASEAFGVVQAADNTGAYGNGVTAMPAHALAGMRADGHAGPPMQGNHVLMNPPPPAQHGDWGATDSAMHPYQHQQPRGSAGNFSHAMGYSADPASMLHVPHTLPRLHANAPLPPGVNGHGVRRTTGAVMDPSSYMHMQAMDSPAKTSRLAMGSTGSTSQLPSCYVNERLLGDGAVQRSNGSFGVCDRAGMEPGLVAGERGYWLHDGSVCSPRVEGHGGGSMARHAKDLLPDEL